MIEAYMQVDLNNPLAVKYHEVALKSFERVSDIFHINVVQCITPDTLLDIRFSKKKKRSLQEKASLCSNYRMHKRIAEGERLFIMEHDAYLRPDQEDVFRMIMSKWTNMTTLNIGIAMECYTCRPEISSLFCEYVENDENTSASGPMSILHAVTDNWIKKNGETFLKVYWPKIGKGNKTGISSNVSSAHRKPSVVIEAPVTQLVDIRLGTTVTDRPKVNPLYKPSTHPNFKFVDISVDNAI